MISRTPLETSRIDPKIDPERAKCRRRDLIRRFDGTTQKAAVWRLFANTTSITFPVLLPCDGKLPYDTDSTVSVDRGLP